MVYKYKYRNVTWVDLESPTPAEIMGICDEFELTDVMAEELGTCTLRSKVDYYEKIKMIYLVLHFPVISEGKNQVVQEIDFIIGKNLLITTRYEKIDPLHNFSRIFEKNTYLDKRNMGEHAGYMFIHLMREVYRHSLSKLEDINDSLQSIETDIFKGHQSEAVEIISNTNRKFLNFKQALRHHGEILESFAGAARDMFGENFGYNIGIVISEYNRVKNTLDVGKEILNDLRDTNDSLLNTKTNQVMKTLTAMTFIFLPITLVAGIFGMNTTDNLVFIHDIHTFFLVLSFMALIGMIMYLTFRGKKWL